MSLRIVEQAHLSDTGRQRTANEDAYFAGPPIFAVADGMGGAQAGEVASRIAAQSFDAEARSESPPEAYLRSIALGANRRIHELAAEDESRSGMGTTFTAALVEGEEISFAHVGDSRAYVFRDGELRLLTSDHSLVEELRRQGKLTSEQAEDHPQRSIITRALGPEAEVEVDTMTYRARPGDVYLLCSDGLTTMVRDEEIAAALTGSESLVHAARRLVEQANAAGGRDNITVVAFRVDEAEAGAAVEEGATLVGPTAADAGLSGAAVREEAERMRGGRGRRARPRRRGEPAAPAKRSRGRTAVKALLAALLVAGIVAGAFFGARQFYFLGGDDAGNVALYRGLPYDLPLGIELYGEVESTPLALDSLPVDSQETVIEHELRSEDDARSLLDSLEERAIEPERGGADAGGRRDRAGRQGDRGGDRDRAGGDRNPGR